MIKLKKLYVFVFLLIVLSCFIIGGFTQFFLGLPNTVFSYGVLSLFFLYYFIYIIARKVVFIDKTIILFFILALIIFISALINKTPILKTTIYLIFVLLPLGCYVFFKINKREKHLSVSSISKLLLLIACMQLPVMLIQRFGFDFFIKFNQSSQDISAVDFMFGTFFLKADHALGFFLLFNIINLVKNNQNNNITKHSRAVILYLVLTILLAESNITKAVLAILFLYSIYVGFPKKIRIVGFFLAIILIPVGYSAFKKIPAFEREVYFFEREYNLKKSLRNFERGIAKRPQVAIVYAKGQPLKIIGDGPYSYFNVLKGKFTNTKHFSQIIWTYADLGIIGLIVLFLLLYTLVKNLGLEIWSTYILFFVVLVYSFMTTIFSDLAIMITLISLLQKREV